MDVVTSPETLGAGSGAAGGAGRAAGPVPGDDSPCVAPGSSLTSSSVGAVGCGFGVVVTSTKQLTALLGALS